MPQGPAGAASPQDEIFNVVVASLATADYVVEVGPFAFDAEKGALTVALSRALRSSDTIAIEGDGGFAGSKITVSAPLAAIALDGAFPQGRTGAITLRCAAGDACAAGERSLFLGQLQPVTPFSAATLTLSCTAFDCVGALDDLAALAEIARAAKEGPEAAAPPGKTDAAAIIDRLSALYADAVFYAPRPPDAGENATDMALLGDTLGIDFTGFGFDEEKGVLAFAMTYSAEEVQLEIGVDESRIPLRDIVLRETAAGADMRAITLSCATGSPCIAGARSSSLNNSNESRSTPKSEVEAGLYCRPSACAAVLADLAALAAIAGAESPSAVKTELKKDAPEAGKSKKKPGNLGDLRKRAGSLNRSIDPASPGIPGSPPVRAIAVADTGAMLFLRRSCGEIAGACEEATQGDLLIAADPRDLDEGRIEIWRGPTGPAALFFCEKGAACLTFYDGGPARPMYGIPCTDDRACRAMIDDLRAMIRAAPR